MFFRIGKNGLAIKNSFCSSRGPIPRTLKAAYNSITPRFDTLT